MISDTDIGRHKSQIKTGKKRKKKLLIAPQTVSDTHAQMGYLAVQISRRPVAHFSRRCKETAKVCFDRVELAFVFMYPLTDVINQ